MRRREDASGMRPGGGDLVEAEAGHEGVKVHGVGAHVREPPVQRGGAAHGDATLRFVACRRLGNRIAEHLAAFVHVRARLRGTGRRRGDQDAVAGRAQFARERRHVHLRATQTVRVVPADCLDDVHSYRGTRPSTAHEGVRNSPSAVSGVPANASRFGRRRYRAQSRGRSPAPRSRRDALDQRPRRRSSAVRLAR